MDSLTSERGGGMARAIDLLHAMLLDGGASSVGAIAGLIGMPLSTAHRQIVLLERRGFLVRAGRGRYVAGLTLATTVPPGALDVALTATCRPVLRRLTRETGYTAHLGVFQTGMVTYLVKEGSGDREVFTREAMQLEAYCSSIGKMLLAQLPPNALSAYLDAGALVPLTSRTIVDPALLTRHLQQVRDQDYAVDDREVAEDINCLAVPVRSYNARPIAAISLATREPILDEPHALIAKLRRCADDIARIMKHTLR